MNNRYLQVTDHSNMIRDTKTGAILIKHDSIERVNHLRKQKKNNELSERVKHLESNIDSINQKLNIILEKLMSAQEKING